MIEIEQYYEIISDFTDDALWEDRAFALGEEWQDRFRAIQKELHTRGLINDKEVARNPFDPATIAANDKAYVAGLSDADLVLSFHDLPPAEEEDDPLAPLITDEIGRRGLDL